MLITWIQKHLGLCASALAWSVSCFLAISPVAANAELTQEQVQAAVAGAIQDYIDGTTGELLFPVAVYDDQTWDQLGAMLRDRSGSYIADTVRQWWQDNHRQMNILSSNVVSVGETAESIDGKIHNDTDDTEAVIVHDRMLYEPVQQTRVAAQSIASTLDSLPAYLTASTAYQTTVADDLETMGDNLGEVRYQLEREGARDEAGYREDLEVEETEIADVAVSGPSTDSLEENITLPTGGTSEIVFWNDLELAGHNIPKGSIDLASPEFAEYVELFGEISTTIWWLLYYTALAVLLHREFKYYASLGHTEGA